MKTNHATKYSIFLCAQDVKFYTKCNIVNFEKITKHILLFASPVAQQLYYFSFSHEESESVYFSNLQIEVNFNVGKFSARLEREERKQETFGFLFHNKCSCPIHSAMNAMKL